MCSIYHRVCRCVYIILLCLSVCVLSISVCVLSISVWVMSISVCVRFLSGSFRSGRCRLTRTHSAFSPASLSTFAGNDLLFLLRLLLQAQSLLPLLPLLLLLNTFSLCLSGETASLGDISRRGVNMPRPPTPPPPPRRSLSLLGTPG